MNALPWRTELAHGIGETITRDYDVVRQFTLVTSPDGGTLRNPGAAPHCLVGMNEGLGIDVAYNLANRAVDRISGEIGTRARQSPCAHSVLNCLQQQIGAAQ